MTKMKNERWTGTRMDEMDAMDKNGMDDGLFVLLSPKIFFFGKDFSGKNLQVIDTQLF
jgi:hypothetical protein